MRDSFWNRTWPLRKIGFLHDGCLRGRWGEMSFKWGFGLGYGLHDERAHVHVHLGWPNLYIRAPKLITERENDGFGTRFGISWFGCSFHLNWGARSKIIDMPWHWKHYRTTTLKPDGSVHFHHDEKLLYRDWDAHKKKIAQVSETHPYHYLILPRGELQVRKATISGEMMEHRRFLPLPWPRKISRYIKVDFDAEVGESSGSWKGGTVGCSFDWREDEPMLQALRRMERETRFR